MMEKKWDVLYYTSVVFTLVSFFLAATNAVLFPAFQVVCPITATITVLFIILRPKHSTERQELLGEEEDPKELFGMGKKLALFMVAFLVIWVSYFVWTLLNPRARHAEFTSPQGSSTVVVEYDFMSRPQVYQKKYGLLLKRMPVDVAEGYNEPIAAEVVWMSEREFQVVMKGQVVGVVTLQ